jgi:hypothetical protein
MSSSNTAVKAKPKSEAYPAILSSDLAEYFIKDASQYKAVKKSEDKIVGDKVKQIRLSLKALVNSINTFLIIVISLSKSLTINEMPYILKNLHLKK